MRSSIPGTGAVGGLRCGSSAGLHVFVELSGESARRLLGGGLGEKDCAVAAASPLVGAREYTFVRSYSLAPSALCPPQPPGGSAGAVWEGALGAASCTAAAVLLRPGVEGYL